MTSHSHRAGSHATTMRVAPGLQLTTAGAVLVVLAPTILGGLLDGVFGSGYGVLTGLGFAAGCVLAARRIRPHDLPFLAVTPPVLFVAAVAVAETIRSWGSGSWLRNEVVAITTALAGDALWIVTGTVATAVLASIRWVSRARGARPAGQRSTVSAARNS